MKKKLDLFYHTKFMRWTLCLIAAIFYAYDFLLRIQPNIFASNLMHFYQIDATGVGIIYAAYYWAYTPLQIPAGLIIDRYNTRTVLWISALLCSVGALLFPTIQSYPMALFTRILMGIGSGFAFIGALKLAAMWLPKRYFATFSGIATALGTIGAIVNNSIITELAVHYGWQQAVLITGYIGLGITVILFLTIRSKPKDLKPIPHEFKNWEHALRRLWFIAKQRAFWINGFVGGIAFLPISVLASMWGTNFLEIAYKLPPGHAAIADAMIFVGVAIGGPTSGWLSDHIGRRKPLIYIGLIASALSIFAILYSQNISEPTLFSLLFLLGLFTGPQTIVFAISKEISPPRTTGTATASTNLLVTFGGAIFAPLIGFLLVRFWDGTILPTGVPLYSSETYRHALLTLPLSLMLTTVLLIFVPETFCKIQHKHLGKVY